MRRALAFAASSVLASGCAENLDHPRGSNVWDTGYLFFPPPRPTCEWQSPVQLEGRSLGEIASRVSHVLDAAGYAETRVFRIGGRYEHGFAVVTRLERITDDGVPAEGRDRWSARFPAPPALEWLGGARKPHLPGPGRYRTFMLTVTDVPRRGTRPTPWDERTLMDGPALPDVPFPLARQLAGAPTMAFYVYEYASSSADGEGVFVEQAASRLSADAHVRAAGLGALGDAPTR